MFSLVNEYIEGLQSKLERANQQIAAMRPYLELLVMRRLNLDAKGSQEHLVTILARCQSSDVLEIRKLLKSIPLVERPAIDWVFDPATGYSILRRQSLPEPAVELPMPQTLPVAVAVDPNVF